MSVDKVILKSVLSTLAAIGILLVFMVVTLCAAFPSTMMEITYDLGMESSSIHFAERAYDSSNDITYIAYATEVAIEEDKTDKILVCGEKFIQHDAFNDYCARKEEKEERYAQFIYGKVYVAAYDSGKKAEAVELACGVLGEGQFPKNNALIAVLIRAIEKKDTATVTSIQEKLNAMSPDEADKAEWEKVKSLAASALNG